MNHSVTSTVTVCPSCGSAGNGVSQTTMAALLNDDRQDAVRDVEYGFCDTPGCYVVYFAVDATRFTQGQLRVEIGVKQTTGERPLCYCFGHSVESIKQEIRTVGETHALDDIRVTMQDQGCRCETENPSGMCCLGSVASGIETAKAELEFDSDESDVSPARSSNTVFEGEVR